jgi:hypothetical protein
MAPPPPVSLDGDDDDDDDEQLLKEHDDTLTMLVYITDPYAALLMFMNVLFSTIK